MSDKDRDYGMGQVYRRGRIWWCTYSFEGTCYRESSHSTEKAAAIRLLKKRIGEQESGHVVGAGGERITVTQLCDDLIAHLKMAGAKAIPSFESHLKPIRAAFEATPTQRSTDRWARSDRRSTWRAKRSGCATSPFSQC